MSASNLNCSFSCGKKRRTGFTLWVKTVTTFVLSFLAFSQGFGQAFNLDQMANGKVTPPFPVSQPPSSQWTWQNGNLNVNNAHFRESYSVPYRCDLTKLKPNTTYVLRIGIDVRVGGKWALDYFTGVQNLTPHGMFGHAAEKADPLAGLSSFTVSSTNDYLLPAPDYPGTTVETASFNALPDAADLAGQPTPKQLRVYNATVAAGDITYENASSVNITASTTEAILRVRFTTGANVDRVLIAWGGHIAAEFDWPGQSAQFINGSPYHCHIRNLLDDNGNELAKGSTDRSLKTDAVFRPATCAVTAAQTVCQGAASPLTYSFTGSTTGITNYKWVLTNGSPSPNVKIQGDNAAGDSDPAVGTVSGSSFTSINIIPNSGSTFATAGSFTLALTLTNAGGNSEPCTTTGTILAAPGQPTAAVQTPLCTDLTMTVNVTLPSGLSSSATVTLRQASGGASPITKNASDAVNGVLTFTGLTFGKGYSITITDNVSTANPNGCTSTPLECGISGGLQTAITSNRSTVTEQQILLQNQSKPSVIAAPNPFNDRIRFTLQSNVSGQGALELYNTLGQKVKTVFQGQVEAGKMQSIEYSVPGSQRSALIYVFRVGDQKVSGKLIGLK